MLQLQVMLHNPLNLGLADSSSTCVTQIQQVALY